MITVIPLKVTESSVQVVKHFTIGEIFQLYNILVGHAMFFDGQENVIYLASSVGTIINRMLGPFVQLKVNGLDNFEAAQAGEGLDEMTRIALPHVSPLVLDLVIQ